MDERAKDPPEGWTGWPENKRFALVLTHDVETAKGRDKCRLLMELEKNLGFRSSFNFVPRRYNVQADLRDALTKDGFEVGVHGLYHDGRYFESREEFTKRAVEINSYLKEWGSMGFRSPSMIRNLDWIHELNIEYDASTFDTDPFEPQPNGVGTIFPFWVQQRSSQKGYVELPYTLPQDFTLFILMKEINIDIWKKKLDWIVLNGGMALIITHPDYMNFDRKNLSVEEYPAEFYKEFLQYVKSKYDDHFWGVLPKDISRFWVKNVVANP
jgi:peptidoglycan/xylan/chitin deacetylase (PgdA/CDA1 family)